MKIIADLHTHTTYSHGKGSVLDNVAAAMAQGLQAIGLADHGPRSAPWVGASLRDLRAMLAEAKEVDRRSVGIRVLAGAECNIISVQGDLDVPASLRGELDLVLAGLHPGVVHRSPRDWLVLTGGNWAARLHSDLRRRARQNNTRAAVEAVARHRIDVITHPGYHLSIDTAELAKVCAERGTAMEINSRHGEMSPEFCKIAAREGARFVISSDAHRPQDVGSLARGVAVAKTAGLAPDQIINSDQGDFFGWLRERQALRAREAAGGQPWRDWAEQGPLDKAGQPDRPPGPERQPSYWAGWSEQDRVH